MQKGRVVTQCPPEGGMSLSAKRKGQGSKGVAYIDKRCSQEVGSH